MEKWNIKITTETGGKESVFKTDGTLKEEENGVTLNYKNEESEVSFFVGEIAKLEHTGDYGLSFTFDKSKTTLSTMTIQGQIGEFPLRTKEYSYKVTENEVKVYLKYVLKFEGGNQNMKVKMTAVKCENY